MTDDRDPDLRETLADSVVLHRGSYISLRRDTVTDPHGERRTREIVVHPGAIAVVPVLGDGRLLLVRQYRHAVGQLLLELPAGTLDQRADGAAEPPDEAAVRELAEETGHRAGRWRKLGTFFTAPGFATEEMHLYVATELEPIKGYDGPAADELLRLEPMHWREALAGVHEGMFQDAKTLVGILWLGRLAESGELPELTAG